MHLIHLKKSCLKSNVSKSFYCGIYKNKNQGDSFHVPPYGAGDY